MRKLMWFVIGFAGACVIGVYLLSGFWLLLAALLSAAVGIGCIFLRKRSETWSIAAITSIGCVIGLCWLWIYDIGYLQVARSYDGETVSATVEISDYSYDTGYGVAADGSLTLDGREYRVRFYLDRAEPLAPGDAVSGELRFRYTADGGEKAATYHQGKGIFLLAYSAGEMSVVHANEVPREYFAAGLRQNILYILDSVFPEDTLAFARALLLGDSSKLTYEMDTAFKVSGIRHVIAVSGLHVSILFSLIYLFSGKRRGFTAMLGIPVLFLFAAVAGFTPSIIRACIMQMLMILALLVKREYDPPTALAFAVLAMLAVNPLTITSVSFQLSVGCMIGIFLFSGKISTFLLRDKGKGNSIKAVLARHIAGSVSVSLSAMTFTTPLCACYFGTVSIAGILTNLLTLWVISFVFYGIMAACLAGAVWLPLGKSIAWLISWPIRYVLLMAKGLSSFSIAAVYTCSIYIVVWLVFCYILLAVFLLSKKKHPAVLSCCVVFGLVLSVAASWIEPRLDNYRMTVLDVGEGQCILLQSHETYYLIDCGGDSDDGAADAAAQMLLSQGVGHLDGLILTHYDKDHAGGAQALLSRIETKTLYLPDIEADNSIREALTASYEDRIRWIQHDTVLTDESMKITFLPAAETDAGNESSMCILFQVENCDILITGDRNLTGERTLLEQIALPKLEILVVGHHGSKTSTGFDLLEAAKPAAAVISAGADNSYGHPSQDVLNRLKLFDCEVWRTDLNGTIIFRG